MAPRKSKKSKVKSSRRGAKLPAKRCPKVGVMVETRAGLIGMTTGVCDRRKVDVAVMGAGSKLYTRGELRKVPKGKQARIMKELGRGREPRNKVIYVGGKKKAVTEREMLRYGQDALRARASMPAYPSTPTFLESEVTAARRRAMEAQRPSVGSDRFFDGL